jgi:hypothetical protein
VQDLGLRDVWQQRFWGNHMQIFNFPGASGPHAILGLKKAYNQNQQKHWYSINWD